MNTVAWGLVGALFLVGCSGGDPVDIGNDEITGEKLEDYGGSWDGYAEAFEFADGSDRVRLSLDEHGVGTVTVGESTAFELSDPEVWPIPSSIRDYWQLPRVPLVGFAYSALETRVEAKRIRFEFDVYQAESQWCELQTPIPTEGSLPEGYNCIHDWGADLGESCTLRHPVTQMLEPIDCGKLVLCEVVCRCDANSCTGAEFPGTTARFDATLAENGDELIGTLFVDEKAITVRLTRTD